MEEETVVASKHLVPVGFGKWVPRTLVLLFLSGIFPLGGLAATQPDGDDSPAPTVAEPSAAPATEPAGNTVLVKSFRITGNSSITSDELQAVVAPFLNQSCTLKMLRAVADRISAEYRRRGFDLAKAYIPAQEIKEGLVTIAVIEGRLGEIQLEGNTNYSDDFIRGYLTEAMSDTAATSAKLERGLLILNTEFPDLRVTADLQPGKEPGTVAVLAKVEDSAPFHFTLTTNNYGSDYVSRYRFGAEVDWTNALISGAVLSLGGIVGDNPDDLAYGNLSYVFPVNSLGTKVGVKGSYGDFTVGQDLAELGIQGEDTGGALFVSHPFVKTRSFSLVGELGFQVSDSKYYLLDHLMSHDKVRSLYAEARGDHTFWGGKSYFSLNVAQGLGGFLDGTESNDEDASRLDADNQFTRVIALYARMQPLSEIFSVVPRVSGQWSSDSLLANEEWQIGGVDSIRGYAPGEASGDYGYCASLELRAAPLDDKKLLQLAAFVDHGAAYRKHGYPDTKKDSHLTGAGVAIYSQLKYVAPLDLRLDVGWPIDPGENSLNEDPVVYFSITMRF